MKSVRETVLEAENAKLRREIDYYRFRYGDHPEYLPRLLDDPVIEHEMNALKQTFSLAGHWGVRKLDHIPNTIHILGRVRSKNPGEFQLGYYMPEHELLEAKDALNVLGEMHKRVIHDLAREYRKI